MKRILTRLICLSCWAAVVVFGCIRARAEEPAQKFLEELRHKKYYDTALEYLDQMKASPLAPVSLKEILAYERGVTMIEDARTRKDLAIREKLLDGAQTALKEFIAERPDHQLVYAAKNETGKIIVERARLKIERSKKPSEQANKVLLMKDAKALYDEATQSFTALQNDLKERLGAIPKILDPKKDARRIEVRDEMRQAFLQNLLLAAAVQEEASETVDKGSQPYKDYLNAAAKQYGDIYTKYRQFMAGQYARMYQGRCQQKLGNLKDALSYYEELLQQPDEFRELKTKSLLLASQCWMDQSQKKYAEVIQKGREWLEKASGRTLREDEYLELRLLVARASQAYAEELKKKNPRDVQANQLLSDARKHAQFVAKVPGDFLKEAQKLLGDLGIETQRAASGPKEFKNFEEAKTAASDAFDEMKAPRLTIDTLSEQLKQEKDAQQRKEMTEQIAEAQQVLEDRTRETVRVAHLALTLTDKDTNIDDVNQLRTLICFLNYNDSRYYEAAAIGEFLAQRFPESAGARTSAKIAMASYSKLYQEAKNASKGTIDKILEELDGNNDNRISAEELDAASPERKSLLAQADANHDKFIDNNELVRLLTKFESDRIVSVCNYITQKWPDQAEAQEAFNTLLTFMITEGQLQKAEEYLGKIPVDSPQRGSAELKMGQALWASYLRGMQEVSERERSAADTGADKQTLQAQLAPRRDELKDVKNRAEKTLADGVQRMEQSGKVDSTFASAVLSLAQIYVDTDQAAKALGLLEHPMIGSLKLVSENHEAAQRKGFPEETYKTALRAYISGLARAKDAREGETMIQKAKEIMDRLKVTLGGSPEGQKMLIAIYVNLAKDLEQQIKLAPLESRAALMKGFKTFLDQVGAGTNELNVLYWIGSTFASMGDSDSKSPDSKAHYARAAETYDLILQKGNRNELSPPLDDAMKSQVAMQLARTKRSMGEFQAAIDLFKSVLIERNMLLPVQMEAARTLQEWGADDPKHYLSAVNGLFQDPKRRGNIIWGWGTLATRTANKDEFHNQFYDARYNLALCQLRFGQSQKEKDKRMKSLGIAKTTLATTLHLYPKIDGDGSAAQKNFRAEYDGLARAIQKALGEKETGITGLGAPAQGAAPGGTKPAASSSATSTGNPTAKK